VAVVPRDLDGEVASTGFCVLRALEEVLESRFLFYFTRTEQFINALLQHVRGANYPAVTDRNVRDAEIPWPARSEQRRIVEILDQADALRQQRRAAGEKAQRILPALFHKLFGDPLASSTRWDVRPIGDITTLVTSGVTPRGGAVNYVANGPYFIRSQNVRMNRMDFSDVACLPPDIHSSMERTRVRRGDVLLNITGASIGRVAWFDCDHEANVNQHVCIIRLTDDARPEYVSFLLSTPYGQMLINRAQTGATRQGLNHENVRGMLIPLPPRPKQDAFADVATQVTSLMQHQESVASRIDLTLSNILYRAFTGELTAQWRKSNKDQLDAEIQEQIVALEEAKAVQPKRGRKVTNSRFGGTVTGQNAGHDMFNKAALVTYIVTKCHDPQRPLGRTKLAKLFYLVQRRAEISLTEQFACRAAGPLDDAIHKFLNLAKKNGWLTLAKAQGKLKPVVPGDSPQPAIDHVHQRWPHAVAAIDDVLDKMKEWGWEALERWATVENAAHQLIIDGKPVTLAAIKEVIAAEPKWRPKLDRDAFSDVKIQRTLRGLRDHGYLPAEAGANH
jgi:type I restriction enzyme S subunit